MPTPKISFSALTHTVVRQASGPLTPDEIQAAVAAITPITTRNPKQTIRNAISSSPMILSTGDGHYDWKCRLINGARIRHKLQAAELAKNSPQLVGELRMIHMCSQSDGACAMIFASEEKAKEICPRPAWIKDHITVHREEMFCLFGDAPVLSTHRYAAERLFKRNGITDPRREIDVFEMYDPSSWWGVDWLREFLLLEGDAHIKMVENGEIAIDGAFPVNPSGGVIASNPIGATAMVRVAEAAMQIMGTAGEHQVPRAVNKAMASGFGGTMWTVLFLLTRDVPWPEAG